MKRLIIIFSLFTCISCHAQPAKLDLSKNIQPLRETGIFRDPDYYNWGGSIIKDDDGKYHLFYSRWKREYSFAGWLTFSEIAHATSDSPTGRWTYLETALKSGNRGDWNEITAHNPKIKYFDGKYYLYYIATNFGGKNYDDQTLINTHDKTLKDDNRRALRENQRTGVAVSSSLFGPWERMKQPIIEPSGPITTLTVNPAIDKDQNGNYFLIVKGDKPNETRFIRNQAIAISKSPTGPFIMQQTPVIENLDTEDVSMWYDKKRESFYAVFHAHTFIGLMTSTDGLKWEKASNYTITKKKIEVANGEILLPDRLERPFIFLEQDVPKVLCLAVKKGDDSFTIFVPLTDEE